jgi:predicted RNA binding protein YcfA (HicA-like mRNA interferase family)
MPLDYSRLRNLIAREIAAALLHDGFLLRRQKGSHQRYVHADGRRVTVSFHRASDTFEIKTLRSMIEMQAVAGLRTI